MNVSFRWLFFFVFAVGAFFLSFLAPPTAQAASLAQIKNVRVHADQKIESRFATRVRLGQFDPTTVRIVVETEMYKSSSNYDVFSLEGGPVPYRVVMDFGNLSGSAGSSASSAGGASSGGSNIDFERGRNPSGEVETAEGSDDASSAGAASVPARPRSQSSAAPGIDGKRIVLDPGHGGSDTGAIGPTGVTEKSIALRIAKRLKTLLEAEGAEVILTRTEDTEVSPKKAKATDVEELQARCDIANQNAADIFLSIHLDAFFGPEAHGTTGYYYEMGHEAVRLLCVPPYGYARDALGDGLCFQSARGADDEFGGGRGECRAGHRGRNCRVFPMRWNAFAAVGKPR